jgi:hypothetical protein
LALEKERTFKMPIVDSNPYAIESKGFEKLSIRFREEMLQKLSARIYQNEYNSLDFRRHTHPVEEEFRLLFPNRFRKSFTNLKFTSGISF